MGFHGYIWIIMEFILIVNETKALRTISYTCFYYPEAQEPRRFSPQAPKNEKSPQTTEKTCKVRYLHATKTYLHKLKISLRGQKCPNPLFLLQKIQKTL